MAPSTAGSVQSSRLAGAGVRCTTRPGGLGGATHGCPEPFCWSEDRDPCGGGAVRPEMWEHEREPQKSGHVPLLGDVLPRS